MYTQHRGGSELNQKLRNQAGVWLRKLRTSRGLSQQELAVRVGAEYYRFISQLETGRGRIPPDRYLIWARALEVDKREFVRTLLSYYDPVTYGILFGQTGEGQQANTDINGPSAGSLQDQDKSVK
jgi:transcriptional regulator with XRE-family HTH domain